MPRTTLDIDATVLRELKRRRQREHKTLGQLASELLASALSVGNEQPQSGPLSWSVAPMDARVDLSDKDALRAALDHQ